MSNKIVGGTLFLLLLSNFDFSYSRPMAVMHEKTFDLSSHELSIQQPVMCPGNTDNDTETLSNLHNSNTTGNLTCSLCEVLVSVIDNQIQHGNHTIIEITEIIKDICSVINGPIGNTCINVIENIQNIIEWVTSGMTSNTICQKLHLCNGTISTY